MECFAEGGPGSRWSVQCQCLPFAKKISTVIQTREYVALHDTRNFEDIVKNFEMWVGFLDDSIGGLNIITMILIGEKQKGQNKKHNVKSGDQRDRRCYAAALEEGQGVMNQRIQVVSGSWEGQENSFAPGPG